MFALLNPSSPRVTPKREIGCGGGLQWSLRVPSGPLSRAGLDLKAYWVSIGPFLPLVWTCWSKEHISLPHFSPRLLPRLQDNLFRSAWLVSMCTESVICLIIGPLYLLSSFILNLVLGSSLWWSRSLTSPLLQYKYLKCKLLKRWFNKCKIVEKIRYQPACNWTNIGHIGHMSYMTLKSSYYFSIW